MGRLSALRYAITSTNAFPDNVWREFCKKVLQCGPSARRSQNPLLHHHSILSEETNMTYHFGIFVAFTTGLIHPAFTSTPQLPSTNTALGNRTENSTPSHGSFSIGDPRPAVCFEASMFSAQLAQTYDCLDAIMKLPISSEQGEFYSDPRQVTHNPFNLPVSKTHGTCNATVNIREGYRDKSSWISVSVGANQLTQRCSVGYYPRGKSGGVMYTGDESYIQIVLLKVGGPPVPPLLYTKVVNGTDHVLDTS